MLSVDKARVAQRFSRAVHSYTEQAIVQKKICQYLMMLMLEKIPQKNNLTVFEIGCGSGNLSTLLLNHFQINSLILNDIYAEVQSYFSSSLGLAQQLLSSVHSENEMMTNSDQSLDQYESKLQWLIGDIEQLDFPKQLDLIASSSVLQWIGDLDSVFAKSALALKQDGWLCFSTFGQRNLEEIKRLTGQGLEYLNLDVIRLKLEQQGFEVIHLSENIDTLYFDHPKKVLQHLKATGVTATAKKHRWNKQSLTQFYHDYLELSHRAENQNINYPLTYHPIYCIARRKP